MTTTRSNSKKKKYVKYLNQNFLENDIIFLKKYHAKQNGTTSYNEKKQSSLKKK